MIRNRPWSVYAHRNGPGLKVIGNYRRLWYGDGYCAVCGSREGEILVPVQVCFWDTVLGWTKGVLCIYCGRAAQKRGPRVGDCAVETADPEEKAALLAGSCRFVKEK